MDSFAWLEAGGICDEETEARSQPVATPTTSPFTHALENPDAKGLADNSGAAHEKQGEQAIVNSGAARPMAQRGMVARANGKKRASPWASGTKEKKPRDR